MSQESEFATLLLMGKLIVYFLFDILYFVIGLYFYLLLCESKLLLSIILCFAMEIIILVVMVLISFLSIKEIKKWSYCKIIIPPGRK